MKRKLLKIYPLPAALLVCGLLSWVHFHDAHQLRPSPFAWVEWFLHDWRVQLAMRHPAPAATNLAVVEINDSTFEWMREKFPKLGVRWPFHHFHYGPMLNELKAQGVQAVALDIMFLERDDRLAYPLPHLTGTTNPVLSEDFFAERLRASGNVYLATVWDARKGRVVPLVPGYAASAHGIGHANGVSDRDGVVRRMMAFQDDPASGRVWALGFQLAAHQLGADLKNADVSAKRILIKCRDGVTREIPLGPNNTFYLDWVLRPGHPDRRHSLRYLNFAKVFTDAWNRGLGNEIQDLGIRNSLVMVGAAGSGANSVDQSPSALDKRDSIFLAHANVANSLLTGRFVQRLSATQELAIIFCLVIAATLAGWRMQTLWASLTVLLVAGAYAALAVWAYSEHRYLLPMALPMMGALLTTHLVITGCRALENMERQRLEQLLKKVVSPRIIDALLAQETPMLESRRLEITVLFADLRGFTRYAEESQNQAETAARALGLRPEQARAFADETAHEAMSTVNRYLAAVADEIKASDGTLDKYMGDCVMAFWGAPVADTDHAAKALLCAIAAEQSLERLHLELIIENKRRDQENEQRRAQGQPPLPLLPLLRMGIGLNSGFATVGFMGSEKHVSNYTTFGHVVNVASRVEGLTTGGQIIATEHTVRAAGRNHPMLVARCAERLPVLLKGVTTPVKSFDVQWKPAGSEPAATLTP